jgi:hypothetical protein
MEGGFIPHQMKGKILPANAKENIALIRLIVSVSRIYLPKFP